MIVFLLSPMLWALDKDESIYKEAILKGQQEDKYVYLLFTSNNCTYCDNLKADTFKNQMVSATLMQYIVIEINVSMDGSKLYRRFLESYENHPFSKTWKGQVPSYFLIDPGLYQCVGQDMGYKNPQEFIQWLRNIKTSGFAQ